MPGDMCWRCTRASIDSMCGGSFVFNLHLSYLGACAAPLDWALGTDFTLTKGRGGGCILCTDEVVE